MCFRYVPGRTSDIVDWSSISCFPILIGNNQTAATQQGVIHSVFDYLQIHACHKWLWRAVWSSGQTSLGLRWTLDHIRREKSLECGCTWSVYSFLLSIPTVSYSAYRKLLADIPHPGTKRNKFMKSFKRYGNPSPIRSSFRPPSYFMASAQKWQKIFKLLKRDRN